MPSFTPGAAATHIPQSIQGLLRAATKIGWSNFFDVREAYTACTTCERRGMVCRRPTDEFRCMGCQDHPDWTATCNANGLVPRFVGPRRNARAAIFMAEQRKLAIIRRQPSFNPLHLRHTHASGRSPTMTADAPSTSAEQMGGTPSHAACHSTTRDHTPTSDGGFAGRLNTRSSTSRQSVRAVLCRSSYVLATAPPPKTTTRAAQRSSGRHSEGSSTWRRRCWLLMGRVPMRPRHGSVSFPRLGARTATRLPLLTARASAAGSVRRWLTGFAPTTSLSP